MRVHCVEVATGPHSVNCPPHLCRSVVVSTTQGLRDQAVKTLARPPPDMKGGGEHSHAPCGRQRPAIALSRRHRQRAKPRTQSAPIAGACGAYKQGACHGSPCRHPCDPKGPSSSNAAREKHHRRRNPAANQYHVGNNRPGRASRTGIAVLCSGHWAATARMAVATHLSRAEFAAPRSTRRPGITHSRKAVAAALTSPGPSESAGVPVSS